MAVRSRSMVPSTASRVLIHIDSYINDCLTGTIYNPYQDVRIPFADVMDFTGKLDALFDALSFPQATMEYRSFSPRQKPQRARQDTTSKPEGEQPMAKKEHLSEHQDDTFVVHVQFRQNATWQGTVKWTGKNEEKRFRSTLELLKIMDSVLQQNHPEDYE